MRPVATLLPSAEKKMLVGFRPVLCAMVTVGRGAGGWVVVVVVRRLVWFAPYALGMTAISTTVTTLIIPTEQDFHVPAPHLLSIGGIRSRLSASATFHVL